MDNTKYYVVKKKAVPEVLIKVVETKRLLATRRGMTIQEATEEIGISRSSFYKYKDDIFPFHENEKGRTVTMVIQLDDTPGVMAELLNAVARYQANILTIHQSIPINGSVWRCCRQRRICRRWWKRLNSIQVCII